MIFLFENLHADLDLKAGDAIVLHCHVLHRSEGNRSATRDRRILFMRYALVAVAVGQVTWAWVVTHFATCRLRLPLPGWHHSSVSEEAVLSVLVRSRR